MEEESNNADSVLSITAMLTNQDADNDDDADEALWDKKKSLRFHFHICSVPNRNPNLDELQKDFYCGKKKANQL